MVMVVMVMMVVGMVVKAVVQVMVVVVSSHFLPMEALVHNFRPVYDLYGPDLKLAGETMARRRERWVGCWDLGVLGRLLEKTL